MLSGAVCCELAASNKTTNFQSEDLMMARHVVYFWAAHNAELKRRVGSGRPDPVPASGKRNCLVFVRLPTFQFNGSYGAYLVKLISLPMLTSRSQVIIRPYPCEIVTQVEWQPGWSTVRGLPLRGCCPRTAAISCCGGDNGWELRTKQPAKAFQSQHVFYR